MRKHLQRQIELVKQKILSVGSMVERAIANAVAALAERDETLAAKALEELAGIDRIEVSVEEDCLQILALYQPVAAHLRFVVAAIKISNDLERMYDLAVNIAKRALYLARADRVDVPVEFCGMAARAKDMVKRSLDALVRRDSALARQVRRDDDELNSVRRTVHEQIRAAIRERPQQSETLMRLYSIARHLARLGDMATNVASDVIYMVGPGKGGAENE